jgi:hypothetical protein
MARSRPGSGRTGVAGAAGGHGASGSDAVLKFMNRRITVMRGTSVNEYGDETDVGTPYLTGVQAALAEVSETTFDAASQRQQIIRAIKARVPGWVDVETTDTIQDEATGYFYMIESIEAEPSIGYYPPFKLLTLRMRSGVTADSD